MRTVSPGAMTGGMLRPAQARSSSGVGRRRCGAHLASVPHPNSRLLPATQTRPDT
ncbi:hypothetical protein [Georgenia sp. SUBG003]|uniref:hypothetical protein n=1 Tax=Georgenia sp. SUBG003 TaxID=1497974 RepID=UPI003AB6C7E5